MDSGYCKIKIITNCSNKIQGRVTVKKKSKLICSSRKRNVVTEEMRNTANYSNSLVD